MFSLHRLSTGRQRVVVLVLVVSLLILSVGVVIWSRTSMVTSRSASTASADPAQEPSSDTRERRTAQKSPRQAESHAFSPGAGIAVTPEEVNEINSRMVVAEAAFRTMERANTEILAEVDDAEILLVVSIVSQPTQEQYASGVKALTAVVDGLSEPARRLAEDRRRELLAKYTTFNQPFKLVQAVFPHPQQEGAQQKKKRRISFAEIDLHSRDAVKVNEDGSLSITPGPYTPLSGSRGFADGGVPRYGYLFERYLPDANGNDLIAPDTKKPDTTPSIP